MGTGIVAVVPLVLKPSRRGLNNDLENDNFQSGFFDNYNVNEESGIYVIKSEMLINNYQAFLAEFYDCIGENNISNELPKAGTYEEFLAIYNRVARNAEVPFLGEHWAMFSTLGCSCHEYWVFYSGSYKALLEEYSTLTHIERILVRAIKNPLACAVKFGIFG
jgi:hypothetical protein